MARSLHELAALLNRLRWQRDQCRAQLASITAHTPTSTIRTLKHALGALERRITQLERRRP